MTDANRQQSDDLCHIAWLVHSRSSNQAVSLELYQIIRENSDKIKTSADAQDIAQGLTAVCFSLWRAVFLSDVTGDRNAVVADAEEFLGNLIRHNMVAYPQDRNTREWTFIYYVRNAFYRLDALAKSYPAVLSFDEAPRMAESHDDANVLTVEGLWNYHHEILGKTVKAFDKWLRNLN